MRETYRPAGLATIIHFFDLFLFFFNLFFSFLVSLSLRNAMCHACSMTIAKTTCACPIDSVKREQKMVK